MAVVDALADRQGVRRLSEFGFADDYYGQEVRWFSAAEGVRTVKALRAAVDPAARDTAALRADLEALGVALQAAVDEGVDFCLTVRLWPDSLQVVMTREPRQRGFW